MIGLWEEHRYTEKIGGFTLRYPKYLAFIDLARAWSISDAEAVEIKRIENKFDLDGEMTEEEQEFVKEINERADPYALYALAFADDTDADDVKRILSSSPKTDLIGKSLAKLCDISTPELIPAQLQVEATLRMGHTVIPVSEQTTRQGVILSQIAEGIFKEKMEGLPSLL